jgi:inorganic pyrophosphatase
VNLPLGHTPPRLAPDVKHFKGLTVVIENPVGSIRYGKDWHHKMLDDYGYIEGYVGADGDDVDCYLGKHLEARRVYVVNQGVMGNPSEFDEHKVMLGYPSESYAKNRYIINHTSGASIFQSIILMTVSKFKEWLKTADKSKPAGV